MKTLLPLNEQYPGKIAEFRDEIEAERPGWIRTRRLMYLWDAMMEVYWGLKETYARYEQYAGTPYWWRQTVLLLNDTEEKEGKLRMLIKRYRFLLFNRKQTQRKDSITDEMIQIAKNHPIEQLVDVDRYGKARCVNPAHPDHHPSMSIKNNRAKCWSCGWKGSVIDIFMVQNNCDFVAAVKALSRG